MPEILVYGFIRSASLLLASFGFALAYGISGVPNFAHGAVYVFAGFAAWTLLNPAGLPWVLAAPAAILAAALLGVALDRLVLRRIRGMAMSELIATYAAGLAIIELLRWAGFRGTTYSLPGLPSGTVELLGVPVDHHRLAVVAAGLGTVGLLWAFTRLTRTGRALRAVAQDERAAMMLGIDTERMATLAVALGCALAAFAAIVLLPLGAIVVQDGYKVLLSAVAVCVVGGLGSWAGTVLASFLLGYAQSAAVALGKPHYEAVVLLLAIVLTLLVRPSGLFGRQKELEERT